jgi:tricarballylate dehydrogenase
LETYAVRTETCDIIVIGGGSAAFEAAVSARKSGAERIVMLEKAPEGEYGGNARYSGTGFRFVHDGASEIRTFVPEVDDALFGTMHIPSYTAADFMADLERMTQGRMDRDLARTLVDESNAAIHWMRDLGIKWEPLKEHAKVDGKRFFERGIAIHVAGGGVGQLTQWRAIAERLGVVIRFDSPVSAIHGDMRRVEGVRVLGPDGAYDLRAKAVIACAGGFQASPEMRARYLAGNTDAMKVRGSKHDTGEVLRYLLDLGVKSAGHWQTGHMSPIDANAPDFQAPQHEDGRGNTQSRYDYPFGISVNGLGVRFFDEGEAQHSYTYAKTGRAVLGQPGGRAFQIYDQKGMKCFRYPHHTATYEEAPTIAKLAEQIGLEPKVLVHTVEEFNRAVPSGTPFDPTRPDGRRTQGLEIPKSNWAVRLDEPPYRAYPVVGGITFTFGGVQVDSKAQVVNTLDQPIKGLFASGDILGLFFHNYPSFTGQTRNAVFGRLAGHAAVGEN